jgi:Holliday junction resolvase RusA-like endonuclease
LVGTEDGMKFIPQRAFLDSCPFGLPPDSMEITLDLPFPPSTNRLYGKGANAVYRTPIYEQWIKLCDAWILFKRQYPKTRIDGPFAIEILLSDGQRGDGDNRIKAVLDYLQSREIIKNDKDCRKGSWAWVPQNEAPVGCRVHLRSLP